MKPSDKERFGGLLAWAEENGGSLHESVEIYYDDQTKFSLKVKEAAAGAGLDAGCLIAACPASLTLSYANALVDGPLPRDPASPLRPHAATGPAFPPSVMTSQPPHVVGRLFLVQQYLLGERSFWWPYIRTLPQPEHPAAWALPAFWPEEDTVFLQGTNAGTATEEIRANARREYKEARRALRETEEKDGETGGGGTIPGWQEYTSLLYNWAVCVFASRSFRPSTVLSDERKAQVSAALPSGPGGSIDDFSVLMPVFDISNHSISAEVVWDSASDPSTCQLRSRHPHPPGCQIFNNYGLKTNGELLLGYGFVVGETDALHNDYIHVKKKKAAPPVDAEANLGTTTTAAPADFLISLRPMSDLSSVVGRARQRVAGTGGLAVQPKLSHIDDSLVWDLADALMTEDDRQALEQVVGGSVTAADDYLRALIRSPPDPRLLGLLTKVKNTLLAKLGYDYDRLEAAEEGRDLEAKNNNQEIALAYRQQCGRVLMCAIENLCIEDE